MNEQGTAETSGVISLNDKKPVRLNLGCGDKELDGYINIDRKKGQEAYPLDYTDVEEIRASHLLEHFSAREVFGVIKNWADCLKVGGVLKIAVPDFKKIAQNYIDGKEQYTSGYIMGGQVDENDYHKCIFDEGSLKQLLESAGLTDIKKWDDGFDCCQLPISLNLQGTKSEIQTVQRTIRCVVSKPRLGFTSNANCMIKHLAMRGIECTVGTGAYWHQVLTTIMEQQIEKRPDYLLTLDYDTWFTYEQIVKMMEYMELTDADAVIPSQIKRESDEILLNAEKETMSREEYDRGIMPALSGHFGCTLFRTSSFEKLKKPWFNPLPGPDGRWSEGRIDADIYFWKNFKDSGLKAYLAPRVRIAHLQLMATFAGRFEDDFRPVHCYIDDIEAGKIPDFVFGEMK